MIQLNNLEKVFVGKTEVHALKGISMEITAGEIFGIIGQSGAGKSTLIRCINMLERPDQGEVWVDGVLMNQLNAKELRSARKGIGMIFQHFNLLSSRTVAENIAFPLELEKLPKQELTKRVESLAKLVGLEDKLTSYPSQLSGGQKQRVGIARALATDPQILLCDEATSALDPETTTQVLQLLQKINQELKLTIVLITHEMAVIQEICDRVAVLENGYLQELGAVVDVFTNPQTEATKRMLHGFLTPKLPTTQQNPENTLLQLTFVDQKVHQPIISQMIRTYGVDANILFGRIDQMKNTSFGTLLVELSGEPAQMEAAVVFLREAQVEVEVLN